MPSLTKSILFTTKITLDLALRSWDNTYSSPLPKLSVPSTGSLISPVYDSQESLIYNIKNININDISNINDVEVYIRTMKEDNTSGVWSDWNELKLVTKNNKAMLSDKQNNFTFEYTPVRFFQFKVVLKSKNAYVHLDSIDIEVKEWFNITVE